MSISVSSFILHLPPTSDIKKGNNGRHWNLSLKAILIFSILSWVIFLNIVIYALHNRRKVHLIKLSIANGHSISLIHAVKLLSQYFSNSEVCWGWQTDNQLPQTRHIHLDSERHASQAQTFHLIGRDPSIGNSFYPPVVLFIPYTIFSFPFLIFIWLLENRSYNACSHYTLFKYPPSLFY